MNQLIATVDISLCLPLTLKVGWQNDGLLNWLMIGVAGDEFSIEGFEDPASGFGVEDWSVCVGIQGDRSLESTLTPVEDD